MNNEELNRILRSARMPEQPEDYSEQFARRVMSALDRARTADNCAALPASWRGWVGSQLKTGILLGFSLACITLILALMLRNASPSSVSDPQLVAAQKYYRELESLFPNQLRVIAFDDRGPHLTLADSPAMPSSPPLYIKICGPEGCRRFVTFSGQQISINGQLCEILLDREDHVLVIGSQLLWPGTVPSGKSGHYDIEARLLISAS